MSPRRALHLALLSLLVVAAHACADADDELDLDAEWGMDGPVSPTPPPGKEDSEHRRGLLVNTDTTRTQVWTARNQWEDRTTVAARKAGLAWGVDSGLTWDEKYAAWIESMRFIPAVDGYGTTFELTTPWGKTLPAPALECAETALFLRITFAAWYELPLFFEAVEAGGERVYFGHNGVRTQRGRYAQTPEFAIKYADYSGRPAAEWQARWPSDATLRTRKLGGGTDSQPMIGAGAVFGAYLDELHLNKRAGYFTVLALSYLGSVNVADTANTYNVVADGVRAGDTLIERWQRTGIGHTLVVKEVATVDEASLDVTTVSGSMPRRQGKRDSGLASKSYFVSPYTGGTGTNAAGDEYARLGGGLKRWRVTKNVGGYWTNTWMAADEAHWINSTDVARIAARPAQFQTLLGQLSPAEQRTQLLAQIADARRHLTQYPASCAARQRRERAFEELYALSARAFGQSVAEVDAAHRTLADAVFAELEYADSKTCCWNSTTPTMATIVLDYAEAEQAAADAAGTCVAPTVFMAQPDGYARWAAHAQAMGQGAAWRAWSEDETCAQRGVAMDTETDHAATPWCELAADDGPATACTDAREPNDTRAQAQAATGTIAALRVCAGDVDWHRIEAAGTVRIEFSHAAGDLDLTGYDASGAVVAQSAGTGDSEQVAVPAGGYVRVFGYGGAVGDYRLIAP
ncbi:MAG: hypothetical protein R2939_11185 [Kofleriaceae bacterium]